MPRKCSWHLYYKGWRNVNKDWCWRRMPLGGQFPRWLNLCRLPDRDTMPQSGLTKFVLANCGKWERAVERSVPFETRDRWRSWNKNRGPCSTSWSNKSDLFQGSAFIVQSDSRLVGDWADVLMAQSNRSTRRRHKRHLYRSRCSCSTVIDANLVTLNDAEWRGL